MNMTLAIDFGTTKTLVAYADANGTPRTMRLGRNADFVPSTVYMHKDGSLIFGDDADDMGSIDPANYCRAFKMKLGSPAPLLGKYSACNLVCEFLKYLLARVKADATMHGTTIDSAVFTFPVNFSPVQQNQLKDAAEAAGFPAVSLITEPEAAGRAFCHFCVDKAFNKNALVVDWGGGTLDATLISRKGDTISTNRRYAYGNNSMGGEVFDDRLCEHIILSIADKAAMQDLPMPEVLQRVRELKHSLSASPHGAFRMPVGGKLLAHPVQRREFERLINADVQLVTDEIQALLKMIPAESRPEILVLVGGTALIPCIRSSMENAIGLPVRTWSAARDAVVLGAALWNKAIPSPDNLPEEFEALLALANAGDTEARYQVAMAYWDGNLVSPDDRKAIEYMEKAAEDNHPGAMCFMAGVKNKQGEKRAAFELIKKSADLNYGPALYKMGNYYMSGKFVRRSRNVAYQCYLRAYAAGYQTFFTRLFALWHAWWLYLSWAVINVVLLICAFMSIPRHSADVMLGLLIFHNLGTFLIPLIWQIRVRRYLLAAFLFVLQFLAVNFMGVSYDYCEGWNFDRNVEEATKGLLGYTLMAVVALVAIWIVTLYSKKATRVHEKQK